MKINDLKVTEIKQELFKRGRSVSGNRNTLLLRLIDELKNRGEDLENIDFDVIGNNKDTLRGKERENIDEMDVNRLMKIIEEIKEDTKIIPNVLSELKDLKLNLADIKNKLDEQDIKISNNESQLDKQLKEIKNLKEENSHIRNELMQANINMNRLDQYSRKNNIELHGFPIMKNESEKDLLSLMDKLSKKLKIEFKEEDIEKIHRLPSRSSQKSNIIVAFKERAKREKWMVKSKITVHDILDIEDKSSIFINNNLTAFNKELLWLSKNFAKENSYQFCWYINGKILIRKDVNDKAILINSKDVLSTLKEEIKT